jgi:arginase
MEEGLCKRLVQVGIRTLNAPQREQAQRFGVEMIALQDRDSTALPSVEGLVYLCLDLD